MPPMYVVCAVYVLFGLFAVADARTSVRYTAPCFRFSGRAAVAGSTRRTSGFHAAPAASMPDEWGPQSRRTDDDVLDGRLNVRDNK